jgi:sensor c-di-GMP phosphodiesterase-like protein
MIDITSIRPPMTHEEAVDHLVECIAKGDTSFLSNEAYKKIIIDSLQGRAHRAKGRPKARAHIQYQRDIFISSLVVRYLCEFKNMGLYCSEKEESEREYIFDKAIQVVAANGIDGASSNTSIIRALKRVFKNAGSYLWLADLNLYSYYTHVKYPNCEKYVALGHENISALRSEFARFIKEKLESCLK